MFNDKFIAPQRNRLSRSTQYFFFKKKVQQTFKEKKIEKHEFLKRTRKCLFEIDYQETRPQLNKYPNEGGKKLIKEEFVSIGGAACFRTPSDTMIFSTLNSGFDPFQKQPKRVCLAI